MSHIAILVASILRNGSSLNISGDARVSDVSSNDGIPWDVDVEFTALSASINASIQAAAIAAVEDAGFTVGALDSKTIFAGASGI